MPDAHGGDAADRCRATDAMSPAAHSGAPAPTAAGGTVTAAADHVTCAGCNGRITDRYYLMAVDKKWHAACLTCYECMVTLDSDLTCFVKDGNIYCRDDYYRSVILYHYILFFSIPHAIYIQLQM